MAQIGGIMNETLPSGLLGGLGRADQWWQIAAMVMEPNL